MLVSEALMNIVTAYSSLDQLRIGLLLQPEALASSPELQQELNHFLRLLISEGSSLRVLSGNINTLWTELLKHSSNDIPWTQIPLNLPST